MTYWLAGQRITADRLEQYIQRGTETLTFTTDDAVTQAVVFPTAFADTPLVFTNIHSGAGSTARWGSRAINITTSGFNIFVFSPDGGTASWTGVDVQWIAVAP